LEQARRQRRGIAELEAQLDRGQIRRRARQQQVTVADGVQGRRTTEGAANLVAAKSIYSARLFGGMASASYGRHSRRIDNLNDGYG
jgi:hypothetical protein